MRKVKRPEVACLKLKRLQRELREERVKTIATLRDALDAADYAMWVGRTKARIEAINSRIRASNAGQQ